MMEGVDMLVGVAVLFLGATMNVQGWLRIGKNSIEFSGICVSSLVA